MENDFTTGLPSSNPQPTPPTEIKKSNRAKYIKTALIVVPLLTALTYLFIAMIPAKRNVPTIPGDNQSQNATINSTGSDTSKPVNTIIQKQNSDNNKTDNSTNLNNSQIFKNVKMIKSPQRHLNKGDIARLRNGIPKDCPVSVFWVNNEAEPRKFAEEITTKLIEMGYTIHGTGSWQGGKAMHPRYDIDTGFLHHPNEKQIRVIVYPMKDKD